MNLLTGH